MIPAYASFGKPVTRRGRHFADAADQATAGLIARTLNRSIETPAPKPLTAHRAAEPQPDEGEDDE